VNPQALDQAKVAELEELQEGLFERLALLFLQEAPADIVRLRGALAAGDAPEARAAAHKIKGGAAAVGAAAVSSTAALLERVADAGDLSSAGQGIVRLEDSLEELGSTLARAGIVPPAS
jgi:two-component system, sensor histidine kinase and response regulator